jgi:hypothetical protein
MQAASSCPSCVFRLTPTSSSSCHTRSSLTSCVAALVARFSRPPARHCYHRQAPCPASFRRRVRLPLSSYTLSRANRAGSKAPPPATSPKTVRQRLQIGCADILPRRHLLRSPNPRNGTLGKPRPLLGPFPAKPGLSLTEFRRFPSLAAARDYIALIQFFSGFPV